jgi:hypothetical protein
VAGAKARSADVDGIGAVKDRFTGDTGVAGRTKFKMMIAGAYASLSVMGSKWRLL